ncbi:MAG: hypothetical protein KKC75_02610 [Nanoarchaeota archaeon]|nr:hypothetical protein [Nanoarchaeota archaeon]
MKALDDVENKFKYLLNKLVPEVADVYAELNQYISMDILDYEKRLATYGLVESRGDLNDPNKVDTEIIKIEGEDVEFKVPKAIQIKYPDGYVQENVRYFGCDRGENIWAPHYQEKVNKICDKLNVEYRGEENKVKRINAIRRAYNDIIGMIMTSGPKEDATDFSSVGFETIFRREKDMESYLSGLIRGEMEKIESLKQELFSKLPKKIKYKHTYRVIRPVIYNADGTVEDTLSSHRWNPESGEKGPGLDENGMPLEVDYEGKVLIDKWDIEDGIKTGSPREVPTRVNNKGELEPPHKQFVYELPLLDIVGWVASEWDSYRDDLRDGRWHPESLTVMEYIMARNKALNNEWDKKRVSERSEGILVSPKDREYKMKIEEEEIAYERKPTEFSPAFDMRGFSDEFEKGEKWIHIGRRYYYMDSSNIRTDKQKDPMISTRGLSMYIIDRICREGKTIKDIHRDLQSVSKITGGFDFGPRPLGGFSSFCKDPLNIDVDSVLKSINPS